MQPKKILHIITKGSPFGGAQKYVFDLATKLPRERFTSVVLVGEGTDLPDKLAQENIHVIRLPGLGRDINFLAEFKVLWQLIAVLRKERPDIVHLNSSKIGGLGALAARLASVPHIVFTAHGWAFNEKRTRASVSLIKLLSWITVVLSHRTIVIAKSERELALNMPWVQSKITLIYNGISPIEFKTKTQAQEILSAYIPRIIPRQTLWVGIIAELHANKNLSAFIGAFKKAEELTKEKMILLIIGDGEERNALHTLIMAEGLENAVFLTGKIENASTLLKAFTIFALPSLKEGLPYTLLEAGLAGLPCLSTYVGGIPEIIRNNTSGVLTEPDTDDMAAGLQLLVSHPDEAKDFGKKLKEKVEKDFSLDKMLEKTEDVYAELSSQTQDIVAV